MVESVGTGVFKRKGAGSAFLIVLNGFSNSMLRSMCEQGRKGERECLVIDALHVAKCHADPTISRAVKPSFDGITTLLYALDTSVRDISSYLYLLTTSSSLTS